MACPSVIGRRYLCFGHITACKSNVVRGDVALLFSRPVESNMALVVLLCRWYHDGLVDGRSGVVWCLPSTAFLKHG